MNLVKVGGASGMTEQYCAGHGGGAHDQVMEVAVGEQHVRCQETADIGNDDIQRCGVDGQEPDRVSELMVLLVEDGVQRRPVHEQMRLMIPHITPNHLEQYPQQLRP